MKEVTASGYDQGGARPQSKKWIKGIGSIDSPKDPSSEKESGDIEAPNLSSADRAGSEHSFAVGATSKKWIKGIGAVSQAGGQGSEATATPELVTSRKESDDSVVKAPVAPPKVAPQSKKWIKGVGAIEAADSYARAGSPAEFESPYVEERGRASFCVTNLDPSVTEDNLWK